MKVIQNLKRGAAVLSLFVPVISGMGGLSAAQETVTLTTLGDKVAEALSPGLWKGGVKQFDSAGVLSREDGDTAPVCTSVAKHKENLNGLTGAFAMIETMPGCTKSRSLMGDGKVDIALACDVNGKSMNINIGGTYAADRVMLTIGLQSETPPPGMPAKIEIASVRSGDC
jgi:hypothetical protein